MARRTRHVTEISRDDRIAEEVFARVLRTDRAVGSGQVDRIRRNRFPRG